ncbi:MAG: hypothetical protein ACOCRK_11195 [bacterium]
MKLITSVTHEHKDLYDKYIVNPITWFIKSTLNTKENFLKKEIERCINSVEIPLDNIKNSNKFIVNFNTDLYVDDKITLKLGGCKISGATIHRSSLPDKRTNSLFRKYLVR